MGKYQCILLLGAPGSGKGTQGKVLGCIPGFIHSSTGDMFRGLDKNSDTGKLFSQYAAQGKLVPDELTVRVWTEHMQSLASAKKFNPDADIIIMDGIPRSVPQAKLLDSVIDVLRVFHLVCADVNQMVQRLKLRAIKENRFDDADENVIRTRMETYDRQTQPLLAHYPGKKLTNVDATMSRIKVLRDLIAALTPVKEEHDRACEARGISIQ